MLLHDPQHPLEFFGSRRTVGMHHILYFFSVSALVFVFFTVFLSFDHLHYPSLSVTNVIRGVDHVFPP